MWGKAIKNGHFSGVCWMQIFITFYSMKKLTEKNFKLLPEYSYLQQTCKLVKCSQCPNQLVWIFSVFFLIYGTVASMHHNNSNCSTFSDNNKIKKVNMFRPMIAAGRRNHPLLHVFPSFPCFFLGYKSKVRFPAIKTGSNIFFTFHFYGCNSF